jgi:hypothetical protein
VNDLSDSELLLQYVAQHSEHAFAELVLRYVDLVYSAAIRMIQQRESAEDVTQKTFVALAIRSESDRTASVVRLAAQNRHESGGGIHTLRNSAQKARSGSNHDAGR